MRCLCECVCVRAECLPVCVGACACVCAYVCLFVCVCAPPPCSSWIVLAEFKGNLALTASLNKLATTTFTPVMDLVRPPLCDNVCVCVCV